jgi:uncharacterized protein YbjQ (UPF0145 family)
MSNSIIVTTTNEVSGTRITAYLGVVRGLVVRTPNIGASILGGLKSLLGGNISQYSTVCEAARQQAFDLMVEHAQQAGADAIIGMRYDATEFAQGATEVLAYGTAVKLGQ